jgi:hypothetical protein
MWNCVVGWEISGISKDFFFLTFSIPKCYNIWIRHASQ